MDAHASNRKAAIVHEPTHTSTRRPSEAQVSRETSSNEVEMAGFTAQPAYYPHQSPNSNNLVPSTNSVEAEPNVNAWLLPNEGKTTHLHNSGRRSISLRARRLVLDTWICESTAMVFSLACLVAIALIVKFYDNQTIPHFPSGITLNTIIAILSTAARSSLIYVICATIGQLKWYWFGRSGRRLRDVQALDEASGGPLGSLIILLLAIGGWLAILGGMMTVLMIVFGPFLQQIVQYPTRMAEITTGEAIVKQNLNYTSIGSMSSMFYLPGEDWGMSVQYDALGAELNNVIKAGLYSDPQLLEQEPVCTTSDWSWEPFKSVGWCTECEDVLNTTSLEDCDMFGFLQNASAEFSPYTDYPNNSAVSAFSSNKLPSCIINTGKGGTRRLLQSPLYTQAPDGELKLDIETEAIWPVALSNLGPVNLVDSMWPVEISARNVSFMGVQSPLAVFGYVSVQLSEFTLNVSIKEASRCLITLCEREYQISIERGHTRLPVLSKNYGILFTPKAVGDHGQPSTDTCWQSEAGPVTLSTLDGGNSFQGTNRRAFCPVDGYAPFFVRTLKANATVPLTLWRNDFSEPYGLDIHLRWPYSDSDIVGRLSAKGLRGKFEGIAASLTRLGHRKSIITVTGRAFGNETYVHIRWVWMILPVSLEIATLVLLLATVIQSHRAELPTWKSSILGLYYHDQGSKDAGMPLERLSDMDKAAGSTTVRLVMDPRVGHVLRRVSTDHQQSAA